MTSNRVCDGSFGPPCESQVRSSSIICQRIYHANVIFVRTCALSRYKFSVTIFSRIAIHYRHECKMRPMVVDGPWSVSLCIAKDGSVDQDVVLALTRLSPRNHVGLLDEGRDPPRKDAVLGTYSGMPARSIFSTLFARRRHVRCVISLPVLYGNFF